MRQVAKRSAALRRMACEEPSSATIGYGSILWPRGNKTRCAQRVWIYSLTGSADWCKQRYVRACVCPARCVLRAYVYVVARRCGLVELEADEPRAWRGPLASSRDARAYRVRPRPATALGAHKAYEAVQRGRDGLDARTPLDRCVEEAAPFVRARCAIRERQNVPRMKALLATCGWGSRGEVVVAVVGCGNALFGYAAVRGCAHVLLALRKKTTPSHLQMYFLVARCFQVLVFFFLRLCDAVVRGIFGGP